MSTFKNSEASVIVFDMVKTIQNSKAYLSEIDGAIGDGDHGINMNKGFTLAGEQLKSDMSLSQALRCLATVLIEDIGGSMGPLYGTIFRSMARKIKEIDVIDAGEFGGMLDSALTGLKKFDKAQPGDKTLLDALAPAVQAYHESLASGASFQDCLDAMSDAAEKGMLSTKDMIAKIGRAARLGERSRGVQDAGATSCCLLLKSMSQSIKALLHS